MRRFLHDIKNYIELVKFKNEWRESNKHNNTIPLNVFPKERVSVGKDTYGELNVHHFGAGNERLTVGCFCSIASGVNFVLGGEHNYRKVFNFPFETIYSKFEIFEAESKGPIVISDDVWIGLNTIIMSGVTIGKGAVVGAGSIVTHDIPAYGIYYNGKVHKYRFSQEIIELLSSIDYAIINRENYNIIKNILYSSVTEHSINELKKIISDLKSNN